MKNIILILVLVCACVVQADELSDLISGKKEAAVVIPNKEIDVDNTVQEDGKIQKRIQEIFFELDGLSDIVVTVSSGVVDLEGSVDSATLEEQALQLTAQVKGVVNVENHITINRNISTRVSNMTEKMKTLGEKLLTSLPVFLLALAVILFFWWIGRWAGKQERLYQRINANPFVASLLGRVVQYAFVVTGIIFALVLLDTTDLIGAILSAAGIFGLAVGFAVRDTVENYIASILLSLRNPFELNDLVEINKQEGHVLFLTSRATILLSPDGNHIRIPNAMVFKAIIVNHTRNPECRFHFEIKTDISQDFIETKKTISEALLKVSGLLESPKPTVVIKEMEDPYLLIEIRAWINRRRSDRRKVRSEAIRMVKEGFDRDGIVIPDASCGFIVRDTKEAAKLPAEKPKKENEKQMSNSVQDVAVDRTVTDKVLEEHAQGNTENLLRSDAPKEMG